MRVLRKTKKMIEIEELTGVEIKDLLVELYKNNDMRFEQISDWLRAEHDYSINVGTLSQWFYRLDIDTRSYKL